MRYEDRVPEAFFEGEHYRGRPADFTDKIISRRVELVKGIKGFMNKSYDLLDIGCGNGASMFLLSDGMRDLLGVEVEEAHRIEFENYKTSNQINNCAFKLMNIETEQFDKQFERLISFEVIEHLSKEESVQFYYDVLKSDGIAAISVPNKWWVFETHGARLPLLPWNRVPFFSWLPRPIHERFANARIYTKGRIRRLLESVGFEVQQIEYITAPLDVLGDSALKRFLVKYIFRGNTTKIPFLSTAIFVVVKK